MRRKHFTQLQSNQQKLSRSRQVASARVKQAAHDQDAASLHEAIARGWKLEHQSQVIAQELYFRRRERPGLLVPPIPNVLDDCLVTLRHYDTVRTVRFSTMLATDVSSGLIGLDSPLGQSLRDAKLMSIVLVSTPLGDKTYQVVAISKVRTTRPKNPLQGARARSTDRHTTEA